MITVNIVDDHKVLTEGLCRLINESGSAAVGEVAHCAADCRRQLRIKLPDVLLLDIQLPDAEGTDLCKEFKTTFPKLKILALSSYREFPVVKRMLDNGADGYVLKNAAGAEILKGIAAVAGGEKFLCHDVNVLIKKKADTAIWLTSREEDLLRLLVQGLKNTEIAEKLSLSPESIKTYRRNLLFKLGAHNTAELVKIVMEQKLV